MMSARRLALARIGVGLIFLARTTPLLGWAGAAFSEPRLFGYPESGWHPVAFGLRLPDGIMAVLAVVRTLAALSFVLGVEARWAGVVASTCGHLALSQDPLRYVNSLHLLFLSTLLLALADSSTALSLRPLHERSPRSSVWLVRGLVMSVYTFSGLAKLNGEFLSGRALIATRDDGMLRGWIADAVCASPGRAQAASIAVTLFELAVPWLLVCRRTRRVALVLAVFFHLVIEVSMHPDVFGWLMLVLLLSWLTGPAAVGPALSRGSRHNRRRRNASTSEASA